MKITIAAMVVALAVVGVALTRSSRNPGERRKSSAEQIDGSPSGSLRTGAAAPTAPVESKAPSQPEGAARLARSELASSEALNAAMPSPGAVPAPPDSQVAPLQQLVVQSDLENEQLGWIANQLAALRLQAYQEEWRRQEARPAAAEQEDAQQAATLQALDSLRYAERMLAIGNSDGVDDELANAETALSGRTRLDVEAARDALANEDLYPARQYLAAALAERRMPR